MSVSATRRRSPSATPFDDGAVIFVLREDIFAERKPILRCNARNISPGCQTVFARMIGCIPYFFHSGATGLAAAFFPGLKRQRQHVGCDQRSREGTYQFVAELIRCSEVLLPVEGILC